MNDFRQTLRVGVGAGLGAVARWTIQTLWGAGFWPLFAINVAGAAAIGRLGHSAFWGTGVVGGFTSFSTLILLTSSTSPIHAAAQIALLLSASLAAWSLCSRTGGHTWS